MNDHDGISIKQAATETPISLGCPQHMPTHLPSGFDGTFPAEEYD